MVFVTGKLYMSSNADDVSSDFEDGDIYCKYKNGVIESVNIVSNEDGSSMYGLNKVAKNHYDEMLHIEELDFKITGKKRYETKYSLLYLMDKAFYPDNIKRSVLMEQVMISHSKNDAPERMLIAGANFYECFNHDEQRVDQLEEGEEVEDDDDSDSDVNKEDSGSTKRKVPSSDNEMGNESAAGKSDDQPRKKSRAENEENSSQEITEEPFEDSIIKMMDMYDEATDYEGFDSKNIRARFMAKCKGKRDFVELLLKSLLVYVKAGNNVDRMNFKRKDEKTSKELIKSLSALSLGRTASTKDSLTLPRIGLAFMSELIVFRRTMVKDLQVQVDCLCEAAFQDVAFAGCPMINNKTDYDKFYKSFGGLISNSGKGYKEDEEGAKKHDADTARWKKVACDGYSKDNTMNERVKKALMVNDKKAAIQFIGDSYDVYDAE